MSVTSESIAKALLAAAEIYEKELTPEQVALYISFLKDLTEEQLANAMREHIATSKWWPKPSEILELARKHEPKPEALQHKAEIQCCENTQSLVNKYGDGREIKRIIE